MCNRRRPMNWSDVLDAVIFATLASFVIMWTHDAHAQTGSAKLSWTAPTKNTDGSTLTNLASFKAYWGASSTALTNSAPIAGGPTAVMAVVPNLAAGTWYFAVAALSSTGAESAKSNIAQALVTIPLPPIQTPPLSVAGPVYALQTTDDALVILEVGSVVAGKPCDPTQAISQAGKTYLLITKANVTGLVGQQLTAVFGTCQ